MTYLRFTPAEYLVICHSCRPLDLTQQSPGTLKRRLAEALAGTHPELAGRVARLRVMQQLILHRHLLEQQQPPSGHGLTDEELGVLTEAFGPLLFHSRFLQPLLPVLIRQFRDGQPELAAKLENLRYHEFELICAQLQARARREA